MRALAALALVAGLARAAAAAPLPPDVIIARVDAAKAGVTTLAGEFAQKNKVKLFKQELASKGRLLFEKPRKIRWEYVAPDPSVLILDGDKATLATPGAAKQEFDLAKDATMRAIFEQLLTWLGPGSLAKAEADYTFSGSGAPSSPTLSMTPRPESAIAKVFARIDLALDGKTYLLRSIRLVEKNGDEKEIVFTKLSRNAKLAPDAFK